MHNSCMLCTIRMHNYTQQTCTMLSTTHDSFALCRFVVELCITFQKSEKNYAQVHNSKILCSEYCALHNFALCPRVLSILHIFVLQHVNCAIVHYFEQFEPRLEWQLTVESEHVLQRYSNKYKYRMPPWNSMDINGTGAIIFSSSFLS